MELVEKELEEIEKELKELEKGYFENIWKTPLGYLIKFSKGNVLVGEKRIHITRLEVEKGKDFLCERIKKYLAGKKLLKVEKIKGERIFFFHFPGFSLVVELFGKGNIILLDEKNTIMEAKEKREWRDRAIKEGEIYKLPPKKEGKSEIGKLIMKGWGKKYVEWARKFSNDVDKMEKILEEAKKGCFFFPDNNEVGIIPIYKEWVEKESLSEAIDEALKQELEKPMENPFYTQLKKAKESVEREIEKLEKEIEWIYLNYEKLEFILNHLKEKEIIEKLREKGWEIEIDWEKKRVRVKSPHHDQ